MIKGRICNSCKKEVCRSELDKNLSICPFCGYYMRFHAKKRIISLADKNTFCEWDADKKWYNPLDDEAYQKKMRETTERHSLNDAIITGEMCINKIKVAIGVMDTRYMMASMGHIVGEKVTRLFEKAKRKKMPVILFCCSGGARMQEGIISLMQMEKTVAAVKRHSESGLLYISVLTNPTMGGVTASFALLADIVLAEKGAKIGFAGRRVMELNTDMRLPSDFQTAEFQLVHGYIDNIILREETREYLSQMLTLHLQNRVHFNIQNSDDQFENIKNVECSRDAWSTVQIARSVKRPTSLDYINSIFDEFVEFHGDKAGEDDHAIVGGVARICGIAVTVIGQQKGKRSIDEAIFRNWGMPSPGGYRKALRLMKQAEKFKRPIICFIDTIGAACGVEAEEKGQCYVIANLLNEASTINVPILSIIHGEGGSGGALALSVANEVWMLENAVYSILTPEGYASILWRDNEKANEASRLMKLTARDLKKISIVDKIFYEPDDLSVDNMRSLCLQLRNNIGSFISKYSRKTHNNILKSRYKRFRKF